MTMRVLAALVVLCAGLTPQLACVDAIAKEAWQGARSAPGAQEAALRVLASNGVKAAIEQLQPLLERQARGPIDVAFGTSASTRQRIMDGEPFDVAILTTETIDGLTSAGALAPGSRVALGRSGIGIGMRAGAGKLDLQSPDALKHILLAERAITYAGDGASRPHIEAMFDALGITDAMKPKTILEQGSLRAAARVVQGDASMVITLVSEILPIQGLELAAPLPDEFQNYVSFAAAVSATAREGAAAQAFVTRLASAEASAVFEAKGIERRE